MPRQHVVFVSYSSRDAGIARKVVALGRAFGVEPWRDEADLRPGDDWQIVIAETISTCDRMLVLWCRHSQRSTEVMREIDQAIRFGKRISLVRIDRATLGAKLGHLHAIDVSGLMWWSHEIARVEVGLLAAGLFLLVVGSLVHVLL